MDGDFIRKLKRDFGELKPLFWISENRDRYKGPEYFWKRVDKSLENPYTYYQEAIDIYREFEKMVYGNPYVIMSGFRNIYGEGVIIPCFLSACPVIVPGVGKIPAGYILETYPGEKQNSRELLEEQNRKYWQYYHSNVEACVIRNYNTCQRRGTTSKETDDFKQRFDEFQKNTVERLKNDYWKVYKENQRLTIIFTRKEYDLLIHKASEENKKNKEKTGKRKKLRLDWYSIIRKTLWYAVVIIFSSLVMFFYLKRMGIF